MILLRGVGCRGQLGVSYSRFCINVSLQTWHEEPWSLMYSKCWFFERWPYVQGCVSIWEGFYGYSDADILCIPFWYTMSIEMTKKIIFKPRESSPRVDGVWTCQIIAIETFRCKLKRGSQIILGGMGTIPYIWQCYPLASLFDSASWHFVQVGHRLPKDGEQKKIIIVFTLLLWWKRALLIDGYWYAFTMVLLFGLLWWVWPMISKWSRWEKNEDRAWIFCSLRRGLVMLDLATGINDWLRKVTRSFEFFSSSTGHRSQGIRPCKRILKT